MDTNSAKIKAKISEVIKAANEVKTLMAKLDRASKAELAPDAKKASAVFKDVGKDMTAASRATMPKKRGRPSLALQKAMAKKIAAKHPAAKHPAAKKPANKKPAVAVKPKHPAKMSTDALDSRHGE